MQVHWDAVEPHKHKLHEQIRALQPGTMSWSNVCDYYSLNGFHAMARACAPSNAVHHLHSMNWMLETKGACFLDYQVSHTGPGVGKVCL